MSRYPGSQFIVIDNTATTATVPITTKNPASPTYMTSFNSVKGPEEMKTVYGSEFYDMYGSQANVLFSTYGQPLLQASMDINAGAQLICKRAVLDDAKLANTTLAVILTKSTKAEPTVTLDENGHISSFTVPYAVKKENSVSVYTETKYTIRPVMVSVRDNTPVPMNVEGCKYYDLHKADIINTILGGTDIDGCYDINTGASVSGTVTLADGRQTTKTFNLISENKIPNAFAEVELDWAIEDVSDYDAPTGAVFTVNTAAEADDYRTFVSGTSAILTDATDEAALKIISAYTTKEYVFPVFTLFDNGRGTSTKSVSFAYDVATSKTLSKAVYTLKVTDYATNKVLESMAFTLDPYTRNNNTGYTFDIESAVNFGSKQIKAKMHYDSYEKLLETLSKEVRTDEYVFINTDCIFNHDLKGNNLVNGRIVNGLYVDAAATANNLDTLDEDSDTLAYYYYNFTTRYRQGLSEKLFFGHDGTLDERLGDEVKSEITTVEVNTAYKYSTGLDTEDDLEDYNADTTIYFQVQINPTGNGRDGKYLITKYDSKGNKTVITKWARLAKSPVTIGTGNDAVTTYTYDEYTVTTSYTWENLYQEQYMKFFDGTFNKDIFNLDIYFPQCVFDANYNRDVKLAIQRLSAYRGDFIAYMDMGIGKVASYVDVLNLVPTGIDKEDEFSDMYSYKYIRDMHNAVTCISYDIRDPYTNKQITVTGTYGLSIAMVNHYITGPGKVFAGKSNGITFGNAIESTVNYIPKIYPTSAITLNAIGMTYPSDDSAIMNEKQILCDAHVNYGSYYENLFTMDTEYTLNPTESEFTYINNVMLVNQLIQNIRKACPAARYNFIDGKDLEIYEKAVNTEINKLRSNFASVKFKYLQDENSIANKIFYAALEIAFRPFAQAEIFTITALNYSTLDSNVTTA